MLWRIHEGLLPGRAAELDKLLKALGDHVQWVRGGVLDMPMPWLLDPEDAAAGALALTTIQDARALLGKWAVTPGLYFDLRKFDVSYWLPRIAPTLPVLNRLGMFVPVGQVPFIPFPLWFADPALIAHNGGVFVRPDSGLKPFAGWTLNAGAIHTWCDVADAIERNGRQLPPELMLYLARGRQLDPLEWRFWIVDREVVASTPYRWADGAVPWEPPPAAALEIAEKMAANPWQPDIAFVVDVVKETGVAGGWYLNEINATSTSGLYNVQFDPLITALRAAVVRELAGELSIED